MLNKRAHIYGGRRKASWSFLIECWQTKLFRLYSPLEKQRYESLAQTVCIVHVIMDSFWER